MLNLVVVVDREWRGEIVNRLEQVGRYHASRTILCAVEPGRTTIDASVVADGRGRAPTRSLPRAHSRARELDIGPKHLPKLDTIVDPLVVPDLPTLVWSPHGHARRSTRCFGISQIVLIDSRGRARPARRV